MRCPRHGRGWWRRRRGREEGSRDDDRIARAIDHVERRLEITAEQREDWERLKEAVRSGAEVLRTAADGAAAAATAPARLARMEEMAEVGVAGLKRLRPAFDSLYEALNDGQKRTLDSLFLRRGHRFAWH